VQIWMISVNFSVHVRTISVNFSVHVLIISVNFSVQLRIISVKFSVHVRTISVNVSAHVLIISVNFSVQVRIISVNFSVQVWINFKCMTRCLRNTGLAFSVKPVGAKCYVEGNVTMNNCTGFNTTQIRLVGHTIVCL
jgi:hypothetical protein